MPFESPEAAAMSTFPARHCRVVASRAHGDDAYVLLDTGSDGRRYLYGVNCFRLDGQWYEGSSSNGPGWSQMGPDPQLGTLTIWGEAETDAETVEVELDGSVVEITVKDGIYFAAWFRVPCDGSNF